MSAHTPRSARLGSPGSGEQQRAKWATAVVHDSGVEQDRQRMGTTAQEQEIEPPGEDTIGGELVAHDHAGCARCRYGAVRSGFPAVTRCS